MLTDKVAVVTGGCSGIGLATVEAMIAAGARVVIADIQRDSGAALEASFEGRAAFALCDVTRESDIERAIALAVSRFGGLDILFNNAGAACTRATLEDMQAAEWDAAFAMLLRGPMLGSKHAVPAMRKRGCGVIINTASVAALEAGFGPLAYSVAKAGLLHLTKLNAATLGRDNIRVNVLLPGMIATGIVGVGQPAAVAAELTRRVATRAHDIQPIPRAGLPEDIASAVIYLASDAGRFVSGAQFTIDGGLTTGHRHAWDPATASPFVEMLKE